MGLWNFARFDGSIVFDYFALRWIYNHSSLTRFTMESFTSYSDTEVWNLFRAGSDKAYEYIYHRYAAELFSYGLYVANDRPLVEDCMHDLFVYLFQHRASLGETDAIKYYLFKSLRRKILETIESRNRLHNHRNDLAIVETASSPEERVIEAETSASRHKHLMEAMATLPQRQREAIFLLYFSNLSYPETAEIMGLNIRTV
jgi:RNA polymerase sigma factor (sigma-70 family)